MDESTRLRMRTAHLNQTLTCACGRVLHGNGAPSHLRTCAASLARDGWPLETAMQLAVFRAYPGRGAATLAAVQRRLGQLYLRRRRGGDKTPLPWAEYRDLVWRYAAEAQAGAAEAQAGAAGEPGPGDC